MSKVAKFEELIAWQIQRAIVSIISNIAKPATAGMFPIPTKQAIWSRCASGRCSKKTINC